MGTERHRMKHRTNPDFLHGKIRRMCYRGNRGAERHVAEWCRRADEALRGERVELWQHATVAGHMVTRAALGDDSFTVDDWDREILDGNAGGWGQLVASIAWLRTASVVGWRLCRIGEPDDTPAGCDLFPDHSGPLDGCVCGWYLTSNRSAAEFHREHGGLVIASERVRPGKWPEWHPEQWQVRKVRTSGPVGYSADPFDPALSARAARVLFLNESCGP